MAIHAATLVHRSRRGTADSRGFREGLTDVVPIALGLAPFGLAIGVAIAESGLSRVAGWTGSWLLFHGSAQIAAISALASGAAGVAVLGTVWLVGSRLVIYSAALRTRFIEQPAWFRWLAPYFLVDPLYGLVSERAGDDWDPARWRWYYLGAAMGIWLVWLPAMGVGAGLGRSLPSWVELDFAIPAVLLAMLVPGVRTRSAFLAVIVGAAVAVSAASLPAGLGLLAATLAGMTAGAWMEGVTRE